MAVIIIIKCEDGTIVNAPIMGPPVIIGRSSKADIRIEDPLISSRHCSIELKNNAIIFKDLGSTNGSFLHNSQISSVQIRCGDLVRIGSTHLSIDESKLSPKERIDHTHAAGKTQIMYVKLKEQQTSTSIPNMMNPTNAIDEDQDILSKLEEKTNQERKDEPQGQGKKRPSVGANLAKKVLDNKKTAISTVALNTRETNFDKEESSGQTQFIKLDKKKLEEGPTPKRYHSKSKPANNENNNKPKEGIMGLLKKILGK